MDFYLLIEPQNQLRKLVSDRSWYSFAGLTVGTDPGHEDEALYELFGFDDFVAVEVTVTKSK